MDCIVWLRSELSGGRAGAAVGHLRQSEQDYCCYRYVLSSSGHSTAARACFVHKSSEILKFHVNLCICMK
jgi:hypothetical protein